MEARRRLAILCSHLRPAASDSCQNPTLFSRVANSDYASASDNKDNQNACVFCKIISDESPAVKVIIRFISSSSFLSLSFYN